MSIDWTISVPAMVSIGLMLAGGVSTGAIFLYRLKTLESDFVEHEKTIDSYRAEQAINAGTVTALMKANHEIVLEIMAKQRDAFMTFQVYVAQNYAGNTALEKMEERLTAEVRILRGLK